METLGIRALRMFHKVPCTRWDCLGLSAVKQTRYLSLRHLRGNPRKMCPSVELLRQRSRTNNFNHQKRLDKSQLLGRLVLAVKSTLHHKVENGSSKVYHGSGKIVLLRAK